MQEGKNHEKRKPVVQRKRGSGECSAQLRLALPRPAARSAHHLRDQPDIDRPSTFRWAKTTLEKDENGWYLAGTDLRGEELNGTIIDIDEL
mgnify:CR=1 FL=1